MKNRKSFYVFSNLLYSYSRFVGVLLVLIPFCLASALVDRDARIVTMALGVVCAVVMYAVEVFLCERLRFTKEGVYRIYPLLLFKKTFIPWSEFTMSGVYKTISIYDLVFVYISSSADDVDCLLHSRNKDKVLFQLNRHTVIFTPRKDILHAIKPRLPSTMYESITKRLIQMGYQHLIP